MVIGRVRNRRKGRTTALMNPRTRAATAKVDMESTCTPGRILEQTNRDNAVLSQGIRKRPMDPPSRQSAQSPLQFCTRAPHFVQTSLHLRNSVAPPQAGHGEAPRVPAAVSSMVTRENLPDKRVYAPGGVQARR